MGAFRCTQCGATWKLGEAIVCPQCGSSSARPDVPAPTPVIKVVDSPPQPPAPAPQLEDRLKRLPWKIGLGVVLAAGLLFGVRALIVGGSSKPKDIPAPAPPEPVVAAPRPVPVPEPVVKAPAPPVAPKPAPVPTPPPPPEPTKKPDPAPTPEPPKKPEPAPPVDLVGHWTFDEGSGTEIADGSGSGNGGVLIGQGTRWTKGRIGGALQFDGKGGYVSCGLSRIPGPSQPQTLSFWIRIEQTPTKEEVAISLTNDAQKSGVEAGVRDGNLAISGGGAAELVAAPFPALQEWHHAAYTFDGSTHVLFIDGKEAARSKAAAGVHPPSRLQFGRWTGGTKPFTGALDEVRLYGRALSAEEIAKLAAPAAPVDKAVDPPGTIDLLKLIDPARDSVHGSWNFSEGALMSPGLPCARLQIPYAPPEEYDLTLVVTRTANIESLNIGLVGGGRQFLALLDGWDGTRYGLELIDGRKADNNETTTMRPVFKNDQRSTVVCSIRKDRVRITSDGNVLIDWKADYSRVSLYSAMWRVPSTECLFLACYASVWRFDSIKLMPVTGTGRSLAPAAAGPREPDAAAGATTNGVAYEYYEGSWGIQLPNFTTIKPARRGKVDQFDFSPKQRPVLFAFRFTAYVNAPADGEYTFSLVSKDPSRLLIGTAEVVNNDFYHVLQEKRGTIKLKPGKHALTVEYFNMAPGERLDVLWEGPGIAKGPIPKDALFYPETAIAPVGKDAPAPAPPPPPAKPREERIEQFKKDIAAKDDAVRLAAIQAVRDLRDKTIRTLLAKKLDSDTEAIRIAAIQAMAAQKHPEAAAALGRALLTNQKSEPAIKAVILALGDLGMCAGLPHLETAMTMNNGIYGTEALAQINRIGCPEAAPGLAKLRRQAQDDYQKYFAAQPATGVRVAPTTPNPKYPLAHLYSPIMTALYRILGVSSTQDDLEKQIKKGEHLQNLITTYFCEETEKTFDLTTSAPPRVCPVSGPGKPHTDILLKHSKR